MAIYCTYYIGHAISCLKTFGAGIATGIEREKTRNQHSIEQSLTKGGVGYYHFEKTIIKRMRGVAGKKRLEEG